MAKPNHANLGGSQAPMIGEHPALDLINTEARSSRGEAVDYWQSGADVLAWLEQLNLTPAPDLYRERVDHEELLSQAKALRAIARHMLVDRGPPAVPADITSLNVFLHGYRSTPQLAHDAEGNLVLARLACSDALASLLGPVAEAVAQFLVEADFALVKKCEHPDCILWFYDRARGGRRRWCSMATCGNRHKVARFRKRAAATSRPPPTPGASS